MNSFDIDTKELNQCGIDIMELSSELNDAFVELFDRLSNINTKTGEWIGNSANEYVKQIKVEKAEYINFKNSIYKYGKTLCEIAAEYEAAIKKVGDSND